MHPNIVKGAILLGWVMLFMLIAVVAGVPGFALMTGIGAAAAKALFGVSAVLLVVSLIRLILLPRN